MGNIQVYTFEYEGRRALLFRGFNPSSSFVNPNNAEYICEGMLSICHQFAEENGITDIFIPEQTGWHALTNRVGEGVLDSFKKKYIKSENEVAYKFAVTEHTNVEKIYKMK